MQTFLMLAGVVIVVVMSLMLWASADALRRRMTLRRWRRAQARQRLRCDVSRLTRNHRAA